MSRTKPKTRKPGKRKKTSTALRIAFLATGFLAICLTAKAAQIAFSLKELQFSLNFAEGSRSMARVIQNNGDFPVIDEDTKKQDVPQDTIAVSGQKQIEKPKTDDQKVSVSQVIVPLPPPVPTIGTRDLSEENIISSDKRKHKGSTPSPLQNVSAGSPNDDIEEDFSKRKETAIGILYEARNAAKKVGRLRTLREKHYTYEALNKYKAARLLDPSLVPTIDKEASQLFQSQSRRASSNWHCFLKRSLAHLESDFPEFSLRNSGKYTLASFSY